MNTLVTETIRLAKKTDLPIREICKRAEVGERWFYKFINGEIQEPGANRVGRVHKVLSDARA